MKIEKILTYPVKGIRAISLDSATLTKHGFPYERRFMLLQVKPDPKDPSRTVLNKMQVDAFPELVLFTPTMKLPTTPSSADGEITITYRAPTPDPTRTTSDLPAEEQQKEEPLTFPLQPDVSSLEPVHVDLHGSPTTAYRMPRGCEDWFSARLGYAVVLVYLGPSTRDVLFADRAVLDLKAPSPDGRPEPEGTTACWWTSLTSALPKILPGTGTGAGEAGEGAEDPMRLTFTDVAPYLVVSERSMDDVHHRLWGGEGGGAGEERMDITKFRPNIIVSGAGEAWEEDYWRRLAVSPRKTAGGAGDEGYGSEEEGTAERTTTALVCVHNCARCNSINVDYATGKVGTGESGKILKKLQKDRRVDEGMKYSPVFGRYAFLAPGCEGNEIRVGDQVRVIERNTERTTFDWTSLAT